MDWYQAQDTFVASLENGTERLVTKGEPLPETHELVQRDLAAVKKDPGRLPLFRLLNEGEPRGVWPAPAPPAPRARASSRAKAAG